MDWETDVACPVCRSRDRDVISHSTEHPGFTFVRCSHCGMKFYSPRLREDFVVQTYLSGQDARREAENFFATGLLIGEPASREEQKAQLKRYYGDELLGLMTTEFSARNGGMRPRSLFEVGCSIGWFLKAAEGHIPVVRGCDANPHAAEIGRSGLGIEINAGKFSSLRVPSIYDLVVALDYIEHTYTPAEDLAKMYAIATPGAMLMIKTFLDELDEAGAYVNAVHHVNHFSAKPLKHVIENAGWHIIRFDDQSERVWAQVVVLATKR